jgi:myo-inositol-hexaphosphate 3-phosphohydrolase
VKLTGSLLLALFFLSVSGAEITDAQTMPECQLPQFGIISIDPDIEVNGLGQNVDTIEFWKSPDSSETLMFVTAKDNQLVEVWKYPFEGNEQNPLTHSTFNNSRVNGLAIDQEADLLYVAIGQPASTVSVFSLPDLAFQFNFNQPGKDYRSEPNLGILNLSSGGKNIYVSADYTVDIHNAVTGTFIDEFTPEEGLETIASDSFYQRLYIPDENNGTGIYVYNPDGTAYTNNGPNVFGGGGIFNADAEGIIVYNCPLNNPFDNGEGFIVVSDQRADKTDFEFFDRISWDHLGTLNITGISNTDGIASYPYPLPDYPLGVFAALNDDQSVAIVGWDKIFAEIISATSVEQGGITPYNFELFQNYPNPFNPYTKIKFINPGKETTGGAVSTTLKLYDVLGNEITTILNEELPAGFYEVDYNASSLPSGIYFFTLAAGTFIQTKKMILMK